jgi:hypothetical protein
MRVRAVALVLCIFGTVALAQEATPAPAGEQAPPEVDAALRARIQHFYQAHVDGKFRLADQVVAEDSKDAFFASPKRRYLDYQIVRINYKDDFKKADVVVTCSGDWTARGQRMKVNLVSTSLWRVEDGQWFWYVLPTNAKTTPFGVMHAESETVPSTPEDQSKQAAAAVLRDPRAAAMMIVQAVKADKSELILSSYEKSSGEVTITNGMQGPITIRADINGRFPGLTHSLDRTVLPAGESALLRVVCEPKDRVAKPTLTAHVFVEETGQVIPIRLLFAIPPEVEKQIPKELRRP